MTQKKNRKLWKPYQQDMWTETWESCIYSINEMINDKYVGLKYSPILTDILKYTSKDSKILEAGCGMGQWVVCLADLGYDITGVDFSEPTIKKLQGLYPDLAFVVGDVTDFEFDDESFDAILSWGVVEHFEEGPDKALSEAYRILKKQGILYITVPCKNHLIVLFSPLLYVKNKLIENKFIRKIIKKKPYKKIFFQHEFGRKQFEKYILEAGFEIKKTMPVAHEYGLGVAINRLLKITKKGGKIFHKNKKDGKWAGLTNVGKMLSMILKKISPWMTPDQIFIIAIKN